MLSLPKTVIRMLIGGDSCRGDLERVCRKANHLKVDEAFEFVGVKGDASQDCTNHKRTDQDSLFLYHYSLHLLSCTRFRNSNQSQ